MWIARAQQNRLSPNRNLDWRFRTNWINLLNLNLINYLSFDNKRKTSSMNISTDLFSQVMSWHKYGQTAKK